MRRVRFAFRLLPVAAACLPLLAVAQEVLIPASPGAGSALGSSPRRALVITPTASVQETYSDNIGLSSTNKQSDFATQGTLGVRVSSNSGRVRGVVDYSLTGIAHSSQTGNDQFVNALNAALTGEVITNHLFVDVAGNITQQALSAFGQQSVDASSTNANRVEVSTYSVSPYLRGFIGPYVNYEARGIASTTSTNSNAAGSSNQTGTSLHVGSAQRTRFGWGADATSSLVNYKLNGLKSKSEAYKGTLLYNPNFDLQFSLIGGAEKNNYLSDAMKTYSDAGGSVRWQPSERTSFNARYEHRYFGNSHAVNFNYRTPRSAWSYQDTRDVTTSRTPTGGIVSAFTPLYTQLYALFATIVPDPDQRDAAVRQFLAQRGLSATQIVNNQFLTSQIILQSNRTLTFTLLGIRDTVVFRLFKTDSSGLNNQPISSDGLNASLNVRQTGGAVDLTHRLSPTISATGSGQYLRSSGDTANQQTTLKAVYLSLNTRVTPRSNLGGGVRHVIFDSPISPYTENAIYATYSHTF